MIGDPHPQSPMACVARLHEAADTYQHMRRKAMLAIADLKAARLILNEASAAVNAWAAKLELAGAQAAQELTVISERRSHQEEHHGPET